MLSLRPKSDHNFETFFDEIEKGAQGHCCSVRDAEVKKAKNFKIRQCYRSDQNPTIIFKIF